MDDDFNTPEALAVLFDLAREVNRRREAGSPDAASLGGELRNLASVLGLLQDDPEDFLKGGGSGDLTDQEIDDMLAQRAAARKNRDFARADRIRDELQERGIILEDTPQGTVWRRG
jgi:cysteinyl-tRNA synthetase